ncbi:Fpg/Nei family DNA glycosylase [Rugosimonospora acidiphila]|uniref:Fpg/Nei family DNA glycosylase n=1 Tax=Rugosimonospora acidiphila TaxID=556531 RepID=UPI0031EC0C81
MPEGHTLHRLAERHRTMYAGKRVTASSPQGRFATGAAAVSGSVLRDTEAYGKHLFHHYDGRSVHIHLGLYGAFTEGTGAAPDPVGQVRLRLSTRRHWLDLRGASACELLTLAEVDALRDRLGADPLRDDADPAAAYARIGGRDTPLAALLMDQSIVAGAGLVYVSEVLFRAGIAPTAPGRRLTPEAFTRLWTDLVALMKEGVRLGRIDTVHSRHLPEAMGRAPRMDRHGGEVYVYRRHGQPCLVCGGEVLRAGLAGRNSYWCPTCQP